MTSFISKLAKELMNCEEKKEENKIKVPPPIQTYSMPFFMNMTLQKCEHSTHIVVDEKHYPLNSTLLVPKCFLALHIKSIYSHDIINSNLLIKRPGIIPISIHKNFLKADINILPCPVSMFSLQDFIIEFETECMIACELEMLR